VAYRLRKAQKRCLGVQVAIKDPELKVIDRQAHLPVPTNLAKTIYETALQIVNASWKIGRPIRLLTVTAIDLRDEGEGEQLSLFETGADDGKQEALERSVDRLKQRYGKSVVRRASLMDNDLGIDE